MLQYGLATDVAKHLAENYGDRAWTVCSYAAPTGDSWPLHGVRLAQSYPCTCPSLSPPPPPAHQRTVIEAEVRYAVHHEYAETAVDVIARRCRLSFLNAQATLDALPRVVDIMAEERKWSKERKAAELEGAVRFLASMGLPPGAAPAQQRAHGLLEKVEGALGLPVPARRRRGAPEMVYSRAQFEAGEVEQLKTAFAGAAHGAEEKLGHERVLELVKGLPGFEAVNAKDYDYVLEEAGFSKAQDVDFDEFVEVDISYPSFLVAGSTDGFLLSQICAELREVLFSTLPARPAEETERRRIPVEKSGGGV